jgi:vibriolysin
MKRRFDMRFWTRAFGCWVWAGGALAIALLAASATRASDEAGFRGLSAEQLARLRTFPTIERFAVDSSGVPTLIAGRLGHLAVGPLEGSVLAYLSELLPLFRASGGEGFRPTRVDRDEQGVAHVRLAEEYRGVPIVGAELIVHVKESTGEVAAINGRFVSAWGLSVAPRLDSRAALEGALREAAISSPQYLEDPHLTYVLDDTGLAHLAWATRIAYWDEQGYEEDWVFADAIDGRLVARHALIWRAKYRKIYNAQHGTSLPGVLMFTEGGSSADVDAQSGYDYSGSGYDYFWQRHGRDSWNGGGGNLISSVHYSTTYNNAFWNGSQMAFGDGDGSTFVGLARALDMVAHELTHGVTQATANLIYQNESGALNEAMSDVFGASSEAFVRGLSANTWKIGEDIYTPGTPGDALRYMNNPTLDGVSRDYYPERYTGSGDNGGVHWNSGIANLVYYLLCQGGSHPRGKTSVVVPAIGMSNAERVFYRALSVYMTSSTNFQQARDYTLQAAGDLYGGGCGSNYDAVQKGWDAVAVPRSAGHDYEPNDDPSQANPLPLYSSYVAGYLCTSGNADWFSITKYSYNVLTIDLYPPASRDYDLELWQYGQVAVSYNVGAGVAEHIDWPYGTGTFYIRVFGKNGAYSPTSPYGLSVSVH